MQLKRKIRQSLCNLENEVVLQERLTIFLKDILVRFKKWQDLPGGKKEKKEEIKTINKKG